MIEEIKKQVCELLSKENTGHGMDHINRVLDLALKFAEKENADKEIVELIAILHDVDDHKLFGDENAKDLTNAKIIMDNSNVSEELKNRVLSEIKCIGYSKRLKGISPKTIEGKIVSDADMCDGIGANGILRVYKYCTKHGNPFFDKDIFPIENIDVDKYTSKCSDTSVCHMFEKLLKLKGMMLTDSGKEEASKRHQIIVDFLYHLFEEENVPEWTKYLDEYLNNL